MPCPKIKELHLNAYEVEIMNLIISGNKLVDIAAQLNKKPGAIKAKVLAIRRRHNIATTEELMFMLGRSELLSKMLASFEYPIGV